MTARNPPVFSSSQELRSRWTRTVERLQEVLPEVSAGMAQAFAAVHNVPEPDSAMAQNGLRDGVEIVQEFLNVNELGLALEHLCYMIDAADLPLSNAARLSLETAADAMGMPLPLRQHVKTHSE